MPPIRFAARKPESLNAKSDRQLWGEIAKRWQAIDGLLREIREIEQLVAGRADGRSPRPKPGVNTPPTQ